MAENFPVIVVPEGVVKVSEGFLTDDLYVVDTSYVAKDEDKPTVESVFFVYRDYQNKNRILFVRGLSIEDVKKALKKSGIFYREDYSIDQSIYSELKSKYSWIKFSRSKNISNLTAYSLFRLESDDFDFFDNFNFYNDGDFHYEREKLTTFNPKLVKSILLSASKVNFEPFHLIATTYDLIWCDFFDKKDFSEFFTKEEAKVLYFKLFNPGVSQVFHLSPGWMRLLGKSGASSEEVYQKFFKINKPRKTFFSLHPFLRLLHRDCETYDLEKNVLKLLHEKPFRIDELEVEEEVEEPEKNLPRPTQTSKSTNVSLEKTLATTLAWAFLTRLINAMLENPRKTSLETPTSYYVFDVSFDLKSYDSALDELKVLIKKHFNKSSSFKDVSFSSFDDENVNPKDFKAFSFYCLPLAFVYYEKDEKKKKEFGKIFLKHFNDFLSSLEDLKEQKGKRIKLVNETFVKTLPFDADVQTIDSLVEKCLKIKNFPLEVFLFYPKIRSCQTYEKLLNKVARSESGLVFYEELLDKVKDEVQKEIKTTSTASTLRDALQQFLDQQTLKNVLKEYDQVNLDLKNRIPAGVLSKVVSKYALNGVEDKLKVLSLTSEEDAINYKKYLMLKEVGLKRGKVHDVLDVLLQTHQAWNFKNFLKFVGRVYEVTTEDEFEVFTEMLSRYVQIYSGSHIFVVQKDSNSFLETVNFQSLLSLLRKIKEKDFDEQLTKKETRPSGCKTNLDSSLVD